MPKETDVSAKDQRWALFRFGVIGPLLSNPPRRGELSQRLKELASQPWIHPISHEPVHFGASTIERWFYMALNEPNDPVGILGRKLRQDFGSHPSLGAGLRKALLEQYRRHPAWSYQLHQENLAALARANPELGAVPSYSTVRRFMKRNGLCKRPRRGRGDTPGSQAAEKRFESFEVRSFESQFAHQLWHLDYHSGSLKVLLPDGTWAFPSILAILDDHTRLCIHAQWYLAQTAENLIHCLCQGLQKYALPRALMSDNGSAMVAAETVQGLQRLGIVHERILPHSAYQNGKQEVLWAQVEGRLLAMLEGCRDLTLGRLNEATQVWANAEYNRRVHSEIGQTPMARFLAGKDVGRPTPSGQKLREAFTAQITRRQRQSDGTVSIDRVRFEIPSRYRHLPETCLRYASWDLSYVYLCDRRSGQLLQRLYPQDKQKNADGRRRRQAPLLGETPGDGVYGPDGQMAPLMKQLMAEHAASGRPTAYLPKDELPSSGGTSHE